MKTKKIEYDDDFVIVYNAQGREVYRGCEDYEPNNNEPWAWNESDRAYYCNGWKKICLAI